MPCLLLFQGPEFLNHATGRPGRAGRRAGTDAALAAFHQPMPFAGDSFDFHLVEIEPIGTQRLGDAIAVGGITPPADDDLAIARRRATDGFLDCPPERGRGSRFGRQQQRQGDQRMLCPVFAQSAMKPWMPFSVSG